jgi:hypothetical protein
MGCEKQRKEEGRDIREKKRPETHCAPMERYLIVLTPPVTG